MNIACAGGSSNVFKNAFLTLCLEDGTRLMHQKKRILSPGEMEQVFLNKDLLESLPHDASLIIKIEQD